ncbi:YicC family protein [Borrelia miyamotoi]|uniref:YicC family protein n=1 Tax=Borrelia miyamotoi TaxID=47466 RepID=A0AAX3JNJ9_9SPIR|nr:YicC/YloC family endoribonuclease [Borrelia miyamotoi]QFP42285.1 YicC family protein [Borrelia miyamotoi]QFP48397.1 YicC/YloC family endoribonuclease [Borrelia miyamotoi]QGT56158.1 YicC family protein [Borrelia miyamotoi]QGT56231.1 YicC family protein [Borrelia miyamotoi]WAZ72205.1 YicC family protein [Borrelia miyamotoi]
MKSMTGFFHLEKIISNYMFSVNLKSYNGKFLELKFKLPEILYAYELEIRNFISNYIKRGNVFLSVGYKEIVPNIHFSLNPHYIEAIARLRDTLLNSNLNIKDELRLGDFLSLRGALIFDESDVDQEMVYSAFKDVLEETLLNYDKSRIFEGENTKRDIISTLVLIRNDLGLLKESQSSINNKLFLSLKENLSKLVDDFSDVSIVEEAAKMSIRLDINEEIVRLYSHIDNFYKNLESDVCGKFLEFITQEMHREVTTMSSKAIDLDIRNLVLNMKLNLEKIKEHVRNIE